MAWRAFEAPADGGVLVGRVQGSGPRIVLVHGGPGLSGDYLEDLAAEVLDGYEVAWYQQRSVAPSVETGPFTVGQHVLDLAAVLDALGWPRAWLVGHSWGGYLVVAAAAAMPHRIYGVVSIDPLGCVGDGGEAEFEKALLERAPESHRERILELDRRALAGEGTVDDARESLRLAWPGYYADPASAPPMPDIGFSLPGYADTFASILESRPALEAALPSLEVPVHFVHGTASPIPCSASTDAADRIPESTVDLVDGAGHFVWHERPGAVRSVLDRVAAAGS